MYSYDEKEGVLIQKMPDHFSLHSIFDCGQCFRFDEKDDGSVEGVAFGKFVKLEEKDGKLLIYGVTPGEYDAYFCHFLSLDCDYNEIENTVTGKRRDDVTLKAAIEKGRGIRILRQDGWEALCSFIISQNNNIPRIKKIISAMCKEYGAPIDGEHFAFPTPQALYEAGVDKLFALRTGFRAKYIYDACEKVLDKTVDLSRIDQMDTLTATEYLMRIKGVGLKVASCALLFGFNKLDAFPVDVHIKHLLAKYYPDGLDITDFGPYAGIAQQYLFYYERYKYRSLVMKAVQYITDKDRVMIPTELFPGDAVSEQAKTTPFSDFFGFGAAITGSSCYLLSKMEPEKRRAFLESVYGKNGLGLSVGRLTIGSSDYSAELYSYDDFPFDGELKHFSIAKDENYVIPVIKEILEINPDLYLFASPWSPPGWMKTGETMLGGFMREKYLEVYAEYLAKFVEEYAAHGIRIAALTPQNEPHTDQRGRMPACIWHPETEAKFVPILRKKLDKKGLDTKIWLFDHNFDGVIRVNWQLKTYEDLKNSINGVAFHYYHGHIEDTKALIENYPSLRLHFTEGGPRLYDNYASDHCKWATMMIKALSNGYSSFTGWNLMLDENGDPKIGTYFCGGLVTRDSKSGEISYSGQYRAFAHFAPYITPESEIYPLYSGKPYNMFEYQKAEKEPVSIKIANKNNAVFVFANPTEEKITESFVCSGRSWTVALPPDSVSTVVIE